MENNIALRREALIKARSFLRYGENARNPISAKAAWLRKLEREYGPAFKGLMDDYALAYYEAPNDCIARRERIADETVSRKRGWKTLDCLRDESIAALKAELQEAR